VQCDCGRRVEVNALEEIDFAALGPVIGAHVLLTQEPVGGPCTACRVGHVFDIRDQKPLVPGLGTLDTDGCATLWVFGFVVDAQKDTLRVFEVSDELVLRCGIFGLVLDETVRRISSGVEVEVLEEVVI
jgi:hypothetical protein